ncbi:MAG: hypothetical protein Q8904_08350 [Bacteroidota bacterium]|nr:hypothetical protein [Bacteroidota bacterium]
MKRILTILAITLAFVSTNCSAARIKNLNRKPNEAIIIAKIQIKNGESFLNNKWNFLLNERLFAKWSVWPDDQNYIYMKVPIRKNFMALLQYDGYSKNIPDNYLTIDIKESKIYYIGDIVIHWTIDPKKDRANFSGGAIGAIAESQKKGAFLEVDVIDNYNETTAYFNSKFQNSELIEKELLKTNK